MTVDLFSELSNIHVCWYVDHALQQPRVYMYMYKIFIHTYTLNKGHIGDNINLAVLSF